MMRLGLSRFFFQEEDGIRGRNVTGVQTCALPIWGTGLMAGAPTGRPRPGLVTVPTPTPARRSEERRVGKECRSRWSPYREKKNSGDGYAASDADLCEVSRNYNAQEHELPKRAADE